MIKGSCFHLRHIRKEDVMPMLELMNHPDAKGDFLSQELMLPGVAEKKFEDESRSKEQFETFLIIDENEKMIGRVFHFKTVPYFNSREIGYGMFVKNLHGKGIMTEAVKLLRDYLFNTMLINRLEIHMNIDNVASEKVAINCGFQKEGIARGAIFTHGKHRDIVMYALLRNEWEALS
ncbi:GNAT family N-acetyltransferase [Undibacterium umbellatum]|uniref:GNAT family N-acetyltransferase n=1 Tax=Undibacterium umbellatum TaxID=2762300 RepID=A0ABR6ZEL8_9BURK|nr:GNAT family protein [Undibacterium umbellatum]MBC3909811.1 GNAT family N-acetyltransferase [Undibacterium umbellatum]